MRGRVRSIALGAAWCWAWVVPPARVPRHAQGERRHADRDRRRHRPDEEHGAVRRARARGGADRDQEDQRRRRRRRPPARRSSSSTTSSTRTQTKQAALEAGQPGRQHRLGHLRRRLRDAGDPGSSCSAKLLTVAPCIGTDQMGPSRFGSAGQARVHASATRPRTTARRWPSGPTRTAGRRRTSSPTSCSSTSRTSAQAFTNRFKQLGGKIVDSESFTQGDKTINNVATRVNGKKANVIAFCTSFGDRPAGVRRRPAHARQQDADHQRLGRATAPTGGRRTRRSRTSTSSPTRRRGRHGPDRGGARVRGEDEGGRAAGADRRLHHRRRRDRRDRLRDQAGGRLDGRREARGGALAPDEVQDARRPDQLHADVPQRHRAALPGGRGQQQRRQGPRRAHDARSIPNIH